MKERTQIVVEKDVSCTMRDGTMLYANIYRPSKEGKYPVLLTRHPYSKDLPHFSHRYIDPLRAVQHGYIVIIQDVRGRFQSEGEFIPFANEAEDGYDTVEWAASLPYSTGKVGMFGLSYYGFTQLYAASQSPPHLQAIFPAMAGNDLRDGLFFRNGAFELALFETWFLESIALDHLGREGIPSEEMTQKVKKLALNMGQLEEWYRHIPLDKWPPFVEDLLGEGITRLYLEHLSRLPDDEYWDKVTVANKLEGITVPSYHLAGWYDCFLGPSIKNYTLMKNQSKLIIGPWGHGLFTSTIGERSFGTHSSGDWIDLKEDLTSLHLRWFDYWLKGEVNEIMDEAPIKLFIMGENRWRDEYEWPLARTEFTPFYLHSHGVLSTVSPEQEPPDTFIYDPEDAVPTIGGGTLFTSGLNIGPRDQTLLEGRKDILVYTSEPLEKPLEVTGPVRMKLWALTDAADTDFTAKLVDVLPDGRAFNLTDGIVRARYRSGFKPEKDLNGEIVGYDIDLWATSNVFLPGHRIRIEISSSNFPRYDRNPNTGQTTIHDTEMRCAKQMIFHHEDYPSHVLLPIIPSTEASDENK